MEQLAKDIADGDELLVRAGFDEWRAELRQYKKKLKIQLPQVEPVPLTIESSGCMHGRISKTADIRDKSAYCNISRTSCQTRL
jgi:hypothetical protein